MEKTVSVEQARRILGSQAKQLDDNQIKEIILSLQLLGNEQLLYNGSKVGNENDQSNPANSTP